ncbi:alpha/beta hydrolase [Lysinibacillus pakistanensis]|uniref:Alpha/beta hydrolase n=1 Tax=Lysinibacillus pakistanensis TaxID=759811 RepID=A0AAX3X522_9BACI|nr:alpha/beta hydrolase [Lysinibacillus pakistanensis]MDM5233522.1 alpha/beta hydrolase [Lysinibacillus pakistanensis]WHY48993.1 alpha/beta hydrolase [Lysinibacillus pakistanensis]WHY54004.1 alpha/beta hydrolase [Lysinibacillus pakistanensis]
MTKLTNEAIHYIEANNISIPYYDLTPAEARAIRAVPKWESTQAPQLASITDRKITVRDGAKIEVRIYKPTFDKILPVIVYYHGGGWVFGNLESSDAGCQLLAEKAEAIVVSVDYRLAPEYPFPIPLHDAYDSLVWVYENIVQFGGDATTLSVAGDSAGGNLATVVAYLAATLNGPAIQAQALIYPVVNVDFTTASYSAYGEHYGLDKQGMQWFAGHYTDGQNYKDPLVSPLQIEDVSVLPKTIIIAAEADVLYDEGLAYAQKLADAGVTVEHINMTGLIHSYFSKMNFFEEATIQTAEKIASFMK